MAVRIIPVQDDAALRTFIHLPARAPGRTNFVPPLWADERAFHDPRRNVPLAACSVVRYLALDGTVPVGRVMGIVHPGHNTLKAERTARFNQLHAPDDPATVRALISAVESWARAQGMDRMIGPFGLSDKDPQGLQVEGFEHLPVLATPTNPAYLPPLVEACGYTKHADALAYRLDVPDRLPEVYHRIAQRVLAGGLHVVPLRKRRDLRPWIVPVLRLVNATYGELLGFVPMDEAEMCKLAAQYMPVLDPAFVKIIADEQDAPVAFVVAMPDMSAGIQRAKGRLFPFGFIHLLRAMKRTTQLDLFLGAVRPDHQGRGLTTVLGLELMQSARERGLTHIDSHLVLETNTRMRSELERLGAVAWKRYRVYEKAL